MYELTVMYADGESVTSYPRTFGQLSRAIDRAMAKVNFYRYEVKGA